MGDDHSDEDCTDNEICVVASAKVNSKEKKSAPRTGSHKTEATFTVDDALEAFGFGKFHQRLFVLIGLSWVGDAMEIMILRVLAPQLHCEWRLQSHEVALITSVVFVGMGIGSVVIGTMSDSYGRKAILIISMCWVMFYGFLSAFAPVYRWVLFLRGLVGFGLGGSHQSMTLYSEFLPVKARGKRMMLISIFWSLGSIFAVLVALVTMPTLGWRWMLGLSTIPAAIFVCVSPWLPESARFHVLTGRTEKAMATLARIAKENGKVMLKGKLINNNQTVHGHIKTLFSNRYWKTTLLMWFIWFANTFCYYGIILVTLELYQADHSCKMAQGGIIGPSCSLGCKYLTLADYTDFLWTTVAELPGSLFALLMIDRIGRKKSMALFFFIFSLSILPMYGCIGRTAVTICAFVARAFICGGFQLAIVYTPEVFPTGSRALAIGTSGSFGRLGCLITPFVAQVLLRKSVFLTMSMYCGCSLLGGIACLILPIETMGQGLQESGLDKESRD
ncbi:synaptic vesicle 2-related protein [Clinocottus analis]|uniref:synaptic vesicle 2-related protein n=1 Tax=Clinocottus analis TaxID=304258 RepID=UPI0035BFDDBE